VTRVIPFVVVSLLAVPVAPALAQGPARPTPPQPTMSQIPLKVQLVVSRYAGEKKVSSTPYIISVIANDNDKTSMRMGVDVAVPQAVFQQGNPTAPVTSYSYRSIGTNIDCTAKTIEGGVFKLDLAVSDSSLFIPEKGSGASTVPGVPAFRSFTSTFNVLLRDGQSTQHTSATDPVSGEVLRVDVTVTVLK
jgi:hypothetical protein